MKIKYKQTNNINLFKENLSPVNKYILKFDNTISKEVQLRLYSKLEKRIKDEGSLKAIAWLKDLRTAIYAFLGNYPVSLHLLSRYRDGFPRAFGPEIAKLIRDGDIPAIRFLLTLLQISRYVEGQKDPDYSPITEPCIATTEVREDFGRLCKAALSQLNVSSRPRPKWTKPHFTSKSSPSGPAMWSLEHDLEQFPNELIKDIGTVGGHTLWGYMVRLKSHKYLDFIKIKKDPKPEKFGRLRSLGLVEDTEGKTRVIAMADYWTQTSLIPLHDDLLAVLRSLGDKDLTFGQDIKPFGSSKHKYYSFDLTSATDRLPRFLYVKVLEQLYGKNFSVSWERLMVEQGFHSPDGVIRKYNTGQPMGLYSSWPLLALVHHAIVQVSALRIGFRQFEDYRILGDDIVIRNNEVAFQYQLLMNQLGVGISKEKTLISNETFEFAKRLFYKGEEVTAFPIHGISSSVISGWQDLYSVLETASKRNFGSLVDLVTPRLVERFYQSNAVPLYRAGLSPDQIRTLGKITPQVKMMARKKSQRLGRTAARYLNSFYIISTYTNPEPVFRWVCDRWGLMVGCTTNTKEVLKEVYSRYRAELEGELRRGYDITISTIAKLLRLPDWYVVDRLYGIEDYSGRDLTEPLTWIALVQAMKVQDESFEPPTDVPEDKVLEVWTESLKRINVRILDPDLKDKSRKFQRIERLKSSCAIKAFASIGNDLSSSYREESKGDKPSRSRRKQYAGPR
jgi:hypothetical protein